MRETIKKILREYEEVDPLHIEKAKRSSRSGGTIGPKAVTPKAVLNYVNSVGDPSLEILDFGAGRDAKHTISLIDAGLNVTAHDFHNPNPEALTKQYDVVFASNVLNVQGSEQMFEDTMDDILRVMKPTGVFIANYPNSPRYFYQTSAEAKQVLEEYFNVDLIGCTVSVPIWIMYKK